MHPSSKFRSGFISIVGRPNVGKSTLLNTILGEKIAIVTDKPQTTRNRILGVRNVPDAQFVFLDTPGIHKPKGRLNQAMVTAALRTIDEVDIIVFVVEVPAGLGPGDREIVERIRSVRTDVIIAINKVDLIDDKSHLLPMIDEISKVCGTEKIVPLSAVEGAGVDELLELIREGLPEGPRYFPEDLVTDQPARFMAAEIIRERIMDETHDEIPYAAAVTIESFVEPAEERGRVEIAATIHVERKSQKGIVIGRGGQMLRRIGEVSRKEISALLGSPVHLDLWVKVAPNWRRDEAALKRLGYDSR
ncbi:GTPase Era [Thermodesulfobacteriota bacterium]